MKVVQINGVSGVGSTGKIIVQLSNIMDSQQIENYIISSGYKEQKMKENITFCSSYLGVRLHQLIGTTLGDSGFHSYVPTQKVIAFLEKVKPDIVHLHNIYSYFLNVETLIKYLKKNNIKTVWTLHDFWPITGHCTHFDAVDCNKWQSGCDNCRMLHSFPYSRLFDRSKALYSKKKELYKDWNNLHLVTVSEWVGNIIPKTILGGKDLRVIPNGIDTSTFRKQAVEKTDELKNKFVILSIAMSWSKNKGYDDFIELSKKLADDEIIVLIGLNESQMNNLPENIIGLGTVKNAQELCKYYNMADVYVSASIEETMGLTIVEAMACGTPAVVYNKTALPELIVEGCGFVCEKDTDKLYEAIQKVKAVGKDKFADACIEHVNKNFDKTNQYLKYCEYYKDIMEG